MLHWKEKKTPKQKLNLLPRCPSKRPYIPSSRSPHPPPTTLVTAMSGLQGSQHCSSCWQLSTEHHLQESLKCITLVYLVPGPFLLSFLMNGGTRQRCSTRKKAIRKQIFVALDCLTDGPVVATLDGKATRQMHKCSFLIKGDCWHLALPRWPSGLFLVASCLYECCLRWFSLYSTAPPIDLHQEMVSWERWTTRPCGM